MAVKFRLTRHGSKKKPFYRIVVADERYPRDGRFIEMVGTYDSLKDPSQVVLDKEKITSLVREGREADKDGRGAFQKRRGFGQSSTITFGGGAVLKELIEYIAKALVDNPEQVRVSEIEGEKTSVIELNVAKDDLGKVIGKQGRTARAMRTILSAASTKVKKRAVLEIIE